MQEPFKQLLKHCPDVLCCYAVLLAFQAARQVISLDGTRAIRGYVDRLRPPLCCCAVSFKRTLAQISENQIGWILMGRADRPLATIDEDPVLKLKCRGGHLKRTDLRQCLIDIQAKLALGAGVEEVLPPLALSFAS